MKESFGLPRVDGSPMVALSCLVEVLALAFLSKTLLPDTKVSPITDEIGSAQGFLMVVCRVKPGGECSLNRYSCTTLDWLLRIT